MRRQPVDSTTIKSVGYEARSRTLEIEFESGQIYQYLEVPAAVYQGLMGAESKGRYFNAEIRDDYSCARVGRARGSGRG